MFKYGITDYTYILVPNKNSSNLRARFENMAQQNMEEAQKRAEEEKRKREEKDRKDKIENEKRQEQLRQQEKEKQEKEAQRLSEEKEKHITSMKIGRKLSRMRQSGIDCNLLATGGQENDLQVWDVTDLQNPVANFMAKNVKPDKLQVIYKLRGIV